MSDGRQDVEALRRALYRPGPDDAAVRSYLDASRRSAPAARPDSLPNAVRVVRPRRRAVALVSATALVAAVLLGVPAAPGRAPVFRLPSPAAGTFSAPFLVPVPTSVGTAAASSSLWPLVRGRALFQGVSGTSVGSVTGGSGGYEQLRASALRATSTSTLTVLVACAAGTAEVGFTTVTEDFDGDYQVALSDTAVPCGEVRGVRYRPPDGIVPSAVTVAADSRVAVAVVAGL